MSFDTDVLVVGAGPIGLVDAWGMKRFANAMSAELAITFHR